MLLSLPLVDCCQKNIFTALQVCCTCTGNQPPLLQQLCFPNTSPDCATSTSTDSGAYTFPHLTHQHFPPPMLPSTPLLTPPQQSLKKICSLQCPNTTNYVSFSSDAYASSDYAVYASSTHPPLTHPLTLPQNAATRCRPQHHGGPRCFSQKFSAPNLPLNDSSFKTQLHIMSTRSMFLFSTREGTARTMMR